MYAYGANEAVAPPGTPTATYVIRADPRRFLGGKGRGFRG